MKMANGILLTAGAVVVLLAATVSCERGSAPDTSTAAPGLTSAEMENLVRRSYQYVALFMSTLDLRAEPVIIHYPAFSSRFVSLETSARILFPRNPYFS